MKNKRLLLIFLGTSILLWRCAENPMGAEMPNEVTIEILSDRFNPGTINIEIGTRVIWVNKDTEIHSIDPGTFMNPTKDFVASPNLEQNESFRQTFTSLGTVNYYCSIHQTSVKQGSIIVRNSGIY